MARLLIVHHSPTRSMRALTESLLAGAQDEELVGLDVVERAALEASADDVLGCDGYLLATPANFGYMSGALKHFFDSTFLQVGGALGPGGSADDQAVGGRTKGRPYGLLVHGRYDTTGAIRAVQSIVSALGWSQVHEVVDLQGDVADESLAAAYELGATVGANLL